MKMNEKKNGKMNGKMNGTWNGKMKNEDEWENIWWDGGNGWLIDFFDGEKWWGMVGYDVGGGDENDDGENEAINLASCLVTTVMR